MGVVEAVLPARMGPAFRWLIGATWLSNLGDGIAVAAGPLLIAAQTKDPLLVASGALLQRLPWLLFGLYAGVLADRVDRRAIVVTANALRVLVLAVLAGALLRTRSASASRSSPCWRWAWRRCSPTPPPGRCCRWWWPRRTSGSAPRG